MSPVSQAPGPEVAGGAGSDPGAPLGRSPEDDSDPIFTDRAEELGIDFQHFNGMSGEYFFCETVGPGGALFDYDNDGDLDIYLVQGAMLGRGKTLADATPAPRSPLPLTDRLYRNELVESGRLRFTEVTAEAGISGPGYGMGVAAGDINGDGWIDLYVTNFGPNQLLLNNGDRTFRDVTAASGTQDDRWNTSAAFVDHDRDGDLDLYVCAYVDFSYENHKPCYSETSARDYCGPLSYRALPDRLFRNRGDGTFEDASAVSQIVREYGAALGVVCTDLNGDGWIDIYVANDGHPNQCWMNRRDGTFVNEALLGGCAYNEQGKAEASMGVDAADFDGDGDEDLFMTHLTDETNTLYLNDGSGYFDDYSFETGLGVASRAFTGFGTAWFDFDSDGWLDLLIANGAVKTIEALAAAGDPYPLHQKNQLFHNLGNGRFEEITSRAGRVFSLSEVSRGAAFGDLDNDGDPDVLVMNNAGRARLLINERGNRRPWVGLRLVGPDGIRDQYGARVALLRQGEAPLWRRVRADASYCSANDPRVLAGIGGGGAAVTLRVLWPDGTREDFPPVSPGRYTLIRQGSGKAVK